MKGTSYLVFFPFVFAFGPPLLFPFGLPLVTFDDLSRESGRAAAFAAFFPGAMGLGDTRAGVLVSGLALLGVTATRAAAEIAGFWCARIRSNPSIAGRYVQISAGRMWRSSHSRLAESYDAT